MKSASLQVTFTAWSEVVHQEAKKVVELQEEDLVWAVGYSHSDI